VCGSGALEIPYRRHPITDTLIAATALHYGLTLITNNQKDFPMPELKLHPLK
jgi:hypothetical protein